MELAISANSIYFVKRGRAMRLDGAKADEFLESVVQSGGNIELEVHGKRFVLQLLGGNCDKVRSILQNGHIYR